MRQFSVNDAIGYNIRTVDPDDVGTVDDVLFDDLTSTVRYLVVNTGSWLSDRMVLLTPAALGRPDPDDSVIPTALTRGQVEKSPPIDSDKPVSRQEERLLHGHYGWTPYWEIPVAPGITAAHWGAASAAPDEAADRSSSLRSAREVIGYYIGAADGDIGHVHDLLIGLEDWTIQYIVIDTRNWLPGKKVLVPTDWLKAVDWHEQKILVDLARDSIETGPKYSQEATLDQDFKRKLAEHYGRTAAKV